MRAWEAQGGETAVPALGRAQRWSRNDRAAAGARPSQPRGPPGVGQVPCCHSRTCGHGVRRAPGLGQTEQEAGKQGAEGSEGHGDWGLLAAGGCGEPQGGPSCGCSQSEAAPALPTHQRPQRPGPGSCLQPSLPPASSATRSKSLNCPLVPSSEQWARPLNSTGEPHA